METATNKYKDYIAVFLLVVIAVVIYLPSLNAPFIFDDNHMIVNNAFIKNAKYFGLFFKGYVTSYPIPKGMCRPLLMLTFAFNYATSKLNPIGYHIINLLFHFLNAVLLYTLLKTLKKDAPFGLILIITLLFVVHPINTEAVTYISSRSDLMATFFILSGFILYLRERYMLTLLMYVFALLTKETGLCLGLIVIGYDVIYWLNGKLRWQEHFRKYKKFYISLMAITLFYLMYKHTVFFPEIARPVRSFYSNFLIQSITTLLYFKLFLLPLSLNITHYIPAVNSLLHPLALISVVTIILLIVLAFVSIRKVPLASIGLTWLLIGLLPKFYARLNFVAMEHHFYLASIGVYIIAVALLKEVYTNHRKYFLYLNIGIILIFSCLSITRNYEYTDPLDFWKISVLRNPRSAATHGNLGFYYLKKGNLKAAEEEFRKVSLTSNVESWVRAQINLANILISRKEYKKAEETLKKALERYPSPFMETYNLLGIIYKETDREKEALSMWQRELKLYPRSFNAHLNMGIFYLNKEQLDKAEMHFKRTMTISPDSYLPYYGLAQIFEKKGKFTEAIDMYKKAISFNPADSHLHYFLGSLYAEKGDGRALYEFKKAIEINPLFALAHNDLAVAYASMIPPRWRLAKKHAYIAKNLGFKVDKEFMELIEKNAPE